MTAELHFNGLRWHHSVRTSQLFCATRALTSSKAAAEIFELRHAMHDLKDAWEVEGPCPQYHENIRNSVRNSWPMLTRAIGKIRRIL